MTYCRPLDSASSPARGWPLPRRAAEEIIPVLYAPRWRWPLMPARREQPLDLLGVFPCGRPLSPYDAAAMPSPLRHLPPAAVIAALAVVDGLLPPLVLGDGGPQPPPFRVALFGPGAGAVKAAVRRLGLPLPSDRILHAFAVRGDPEPGESALPPGFWPVLCGAHLVRPQPDVGDGAAGADADTLSGFLRGGDASPARLWAPLRDDEAPLLAQRLLSLPRPLLEVVAALPSHPRSGEIARMFADGAPERWPLLPPAALTAAPALPFLSDRLLWLLRAVEVASEGCLRGRTDLYLLDAAHGRCWALWGDLVAFHARVRPRAPTVALRAAATILCRRPVTVGRTTCGATGATEEDLSALAAAGWLARPEREGARWRVPESILSLPTVAPPRLNGRLPLPPVAIHLRPSE
ncbi:hypothetical protein [Paracoccus endophyticus]|uniref:hypothetical protein n=1 Tax=Paracoccus endophyticus TaxID=2233774 RepID=UPI000DDA21AC|nr:hypothetical protein [Paracoccus endophyticus]